MKLNFLVSFICSIPFGKGEEIIEFGKLLYDFFSKIIFLIITNVFKTFMKNFFTHFGTMSLRYYFKMHLNV